MVTSRQLYAALRDLSAGTRAFKASIFQVCADLQALLEKGWICTKQAPASSEMVVVEVTEAGSAILQAQEVFE